MSVTSAGHASEMACHVGHADRRPMAGRSIRHGLIVSRPGSNESAVLAISWPTGVLNAISLLADAVDAMSGW